MRSKKRSSEPCFYICTVLLLTICCSVAMRSAISDVVSTSLMPAQLVPVCAMIRVPYSFEYDPFGQLWLLSNGEGNPDRFVRVIEGVDYHCYSRSGADNAWLAGEQEALGRDLELLLVARDRARDRALVDLGLFRVFADVRGHLLLERHHGFFVFVLAGRDRLNRDHDLLLLRFIRLLLGQVLKLAIVDDLAHRRIGVRSNLNQVHAFFARAANRVTRVHDPKLFAVFGNHAHLGYANTFVNAYDRRTAKTGTTAASKTCSYCCTSLVKSYEFRVWGFEIATRWQLET